MRSDELLDRWRGEETGQPHGWDFSHITGRVNEDQVPWDLSVLYRRHLRSARHVLDMGTGGGEYLRQFADALPTDTTATEAWERNVPLARAALAPLGVDVVAWGADEPAFDPQMPFPDGRFDLVLNRHEAYNAVEVFRVLAAGGTFLTQQVAADNLIELRDLLGFSPGITHVTYAGCCAALLAAGLQVVDGADHTGTDEFIDVAALVAYLQLVPWEVPPDFSVDLHRRTDGGPVVSAASDSG